VITGLLLTEISVVDRPANPEAVFDCWKLSRAAAASPPADRRDDDQGGGVAYADPGYRPDGRQRYPIDNERHIRAAWAYIHQAHNAGRYTPAQLQHVKARIVAAWQATIDRAGPPSTAAANPASDTARKGVAEVGRLAQIVAELGCLHDELYIEPDASPLADQLQDVIVRLCDFLAALAADEGAEPPDEADLAAMADAGTLRKARLPDLTPLAVGLAKLAGEIMPRLDALQRRVDDIARVPLPPQTAARGFAGIAKREDGGGSLAAADDIVAALARMSEEERTLTLIKAAHANPTTVFGRPAGLAPR